MKVQEIISEANVFQLIGKGLQSAGKLASKEAELGKVGSKAYHGVTDAEKGAGWWGQKAGKINQANTVKNLATAEREAMAWVTEKWGNDAVKFMKRVNLVAVVGQYAYGRYQIEQQFAKDGDQAKRDAALKQLAGMCIAQWIAPKVANLVGTVSGAKWIAGRVPWLVKTLGMPNYAKVIAAVGGAAGQTALIGFFMTPAGQNWLSNTFGKLIGVLGETPDLVGQLLSGIGDIAQGGYNMATGKDQTTPTADADSKKDQASTSDATGAPQQSTANNDDTGFVQDMINGRIKSSLK